MLPSGKFRANVMSSAMPRNAPSCHFVWILGRIPKRRQIAKTAAIRGVYGLASMAPETLPCTSLCIPSVIPLKRPFSPKNRSSGEGEMPVRAKKTTKGFLSIEANQTAPPSAANLMPTRKAKLPLIKPRLPDYYINWNRHNANYE